MACIVPGVLSRAGGRNDRTPRAPVVGGRRGEEEPEPESGGFFWRELSPVAAPAASLVPFLTN